MNGYCVVQRKIVEIKNPVEFTMKNGRPAVKGECSECVNRVLIWTRKCRFCETGIGRRIR